MEKIVEREELLKQLGPDVKLLSRGNKYPDAKILAYFSDDDRLPVYPGCFGSYSAEACFSCGEDQPWIMDECCVYSDFRVKRKKIRQITSKLISVERKAIDLLNEINQAENLANQIQTIVEH